MRCVITDFTLCVTMCTTKFNATYQIILLSKPNQAIVTVTESFLMPFLDALLLAKTDSGDTLSWNIEQCRVIYY